MTTDSTATTKYDPLSMLREIYLDSNSKIITMIGDKGKEACSNPSGLINLTDTDTE